MSDKKIPSEWETQIDKIVPKDYDKIPGWIQVDNPNKLTFLKSKV